MPAVLVPVPLHQRRRSPALVVQWVAAEEAWQKSLQAGQQRNLRQQVVAAAPQEHLAQQLALEERTSMLIAPAASSVEAAKTVVSSLVAPPHLSTAERSAEAASTVACSLAARPHLSPEAWLAEATSLAEGWQQSPRRAAPRRAPRLTSLKVDGNSKAPS